MPLRFVYAGLVAALLAVAVALRFLDPAPVARLRLIVFDTYQQLDPRVFDPALPVRVVHVDEASVKRFGQWPWPRSILATLTKRLTDDGAAAVIFDFVMAEPERRIADEIGNALAADPAAALLAEKVKALPSGDQTFADAMTAVPVMLGFIAADDGEGLPEARAGFAYAGDDPKMFVPVFSGATVSLPVLQENSAGAGALNWVPEYDQVVRRLPLLVRVRDELYPSLAAEALRLAQRATTYVIKSSGANGEQALGTRSGITALRIGQFEVPTDPHGQIWLRLTHSDPRRFISAAQLYDGSVARQEIEGHIILVGMGAPGLADIRTTPLEASITGVEVQAQAIEQMLLGSHLRRPDFAVGGEIIALVLAGVVLALAVYHFGALWSAAVGAAMLVTAIVGSLAAFRSFGLLLDPSYLIIALTCIYIGTTVCRYLQTELERERVRDTFGRYLSDDIVTAVLEAPSGIRMGGEKGKVTMMMSDLRGFTSLSEKLPPERVVLMLNCYLEAMVKVIDRYHGTIDEFIGDAIFVLFGAPIPKADDAERAVACAVAMQLAVEGVNDQNRQADLPAVEMGIGIHTGQVVVGNIGSAQRMKYGVVGSHVNLTARIQSYTTGGQILISEATREEVGPILSIAQQMEVTAKGIEHALRVCEVVGIGGTHNLVLPERKEPLVPLAEPVQFQYAVVHGSHLGAETFKGLLTKLSPRQCEAELEMPVAVLTNLKMHLVDAVGETMSDAIYAKVVGAPSAEAAAFRLHFTSISPEAMKRVAAGPSQLMERAAS